MDGSADRRAVMPVIVARNDVKPYCERHAMNHGFYNACNAALPELPLRRWGKMPVLPVGIVAIGPRQKQ